MSSLTSPPRSGSRTSWPARSAPSRQPGHSSLAGRMGPGHPSSSVSTADGRRPAGSRISADFGIEASGRGGASRLASMIFGLGAGTGAGCVVAVVSAATVPLSPTFRARLLKNPPSETGALGAADATTRVAGALAVDEASSGSSGAVTGPARRIDRRGNGAGRAGGMVSSAQALAVAAVGQAGRAVGHAGRRTPCSCRRRCRCSGGRPACPWQPAWRSRPGPAAASRARRRRLHRESHRPGIWRTPRTPDRAWHPAP